MDAVKTPKEVRAARAIVASSGYRIPELPASLVQHLQARATTSVMDAAAAERDSLPLPPDLLFPISVVRMYAFLCKA